MLLVLLVEEEIVVVLMVAGVVVSVSNLTTPAVPAVDELAPALAF